MAVDNLSGKGAAWGSIAGTLADQTDLNNALAAKVSTAGGSTVAASAAAVKGLILKGAASQSANLLEVQDSAGTVIGYVGPTGNIVGNGTRVAVSTANGEARLQDNSTIMECHIRPAAGKKGYLTLTENAVADRWAIGIDNGDPVLHFRAGNNAATDVMNLTAAGLLGGSGASLGSWTAFTPTFSGGTWAVGNGTFVGCRYVQIGKIVIYTGTFTFGSTTVKDASSSLVVSCPVTPTGTARGVCEILDSGTANYAAQVQVTSSGMFMRAQTVSGTLISTSGFTTSNPITWATNDTFSWTVVYEAA
jgi:hypothetical protein